MHNKQRPSEICVLPSRFRFPQSYLDLTAHSLPDINPWWWLAPYEESAIYWTNTLREQFPSRKLMPFAKHGGSDVLACFDASDTSNNPKVLYINSFCCLGWEQRGEASNFMEWLKKTEIEAAQFRSGSESR